MIRRGLPFLWLGSVACAPQDTTPSPPTIEVIYFAPGPSDAGAPRAAIAWIGADRAQIMDDAPVVDGQARLTLAPPPIDIRERFAPIETLRFSEPTLNRTFAQAFALRPRLTLYDDRDRDGRLDLPPPFGRGADRILAVDRGDQDGLAWCTDIDTVLETTPLNLLERLYALMGGSLTPFLRTSGGGELDVKPWDPRFVLTLDEPELVAALLVCPRFGVSGVREGRVQVLADPTLPVSLGCDPGCRDSAFALRAPSRDAPVQLLPIEEICDAAPDVAVYELRQSGVACLGCLCTFVTHRVTAIADPARLPPWWPCGDGPDLLPQCAACGLTCTVRPCLSPP